MPAAQPARKPFKPPRPLSSANNYSSLADSSTRSKASNHGGPRDDTHDIHKNQATASCTAEDIDPTSTNLDLNNNNLPTIPPELILRICHEHFKHPDTRMTKEAVAGMTAYVQIFVREALARADLERREVAGVDGEFLEPEDLEKLAPQLLLDF